MTVESTSTVSPNSQINQHEGLSCLFGALLNLSKHDPDGPDEPDEKERERKVVEARLLPHWPVMSKSVRATFALPLLNQDKPFVLRATSLQSLSFGIPIRAQVQDLHGLPHHLLRICAQLPDKKSTLFFKIPTLGMRPSTRPGSARVNMTLHFPANLREHWLRFATVQNNQSHVNNSTNLFSLKGATGNGSSGSVGCIVLSVVLLCSPLGLLRCAGGGLNGSISASAGPSGAQVVKTEDEEPHVLIKSETVLNPEILTQEDASLPESEVIFSRGTSRLNGVSVFSNSQTASGLVSQGLVHAVRVSPSQNFHFSVDLSASKTTH